MGDNDDLSESSAQVHRFKNLFGLELDK